MSRLLSSLRLGETKVRVVPSANYDGQDGSTLHQYFSRKTSLLCPCKAAILCNVLWLSIGACVFDCNTYLPARSKRLLSAVGILSCQSKTSAMRSRHLSNFTVRLLDCVFVCFSTYLDCSAKSIHKTVPEVEEWINTLWTLKHAHTWRHLCKHMYISTYRNLKYGTSTSQHQDYGTRLELTFSGNLTVLGPLQVQQSCSLSV